MARIKHAPEYLCDPKTSSEQRPIIRRDLFGRKKCGFIKNPEEALKCRQTTFD